MQPVPRHRTVPYGTATDFDVWASDSNGVKGNHARVAQLRSLGYRRDSLLLSFGNRAPYQRNSYNGSDFYKVSYEEQAMPASGRYLLKYYVPFDQNWLSEGRFFPLNNMVVRASSVFPGFSAVRSLMVPMGSVGWNRFRPGKPVASLAQFLGELRQLPRNPFRLAAQTARAVSTYGLKSARGIDEMRRAVGDQYLNYSFGWRPFLSDLEKIADFDERLVNAMRQLRRDNGRTIRRGGTIESDSTSSTVINTAASPASYTQIPWTSWGSSPGRGTRTVVTTTSWRYWFSAGFVYHLPREDDPTSMGALRNYLRGGGVSPSVVWELTPWSWLADYFTNIGQVLENWESSRALALAARYCYVMYTKKVEVVTICNGRLTSSQGFGSYDITSSFRSTNELKARTWASPYGFGFTTGSLSDAQKANLIALGLSRRI